MTVADPRDDVSARATAKAWLAGWGWVLLGLLAVSASILWMFIRLDAGESHAPRVDPTQLKPGPIQHEQLTTNQTERVKRLQQTFAEVDSSPLEKWIDDFKRDHDPEREIRIYEGMAQAYQAYCSGKDLAPSAKRDVYQVVLARSGAPDAEVLKHLNLKVLSLDDAKEILRLYEVPPAPVTVSPAPPP